MKNQFENQTVIHDTLETVQKQERKEIGLKLLILVGPSPLESGVTLAIFKASGKTPFSNPFLNRYLRGSFNSLKQFLITLGLILSKPGLLFVFRDKKRLL